MTLLEWSRQKLANGGVTFPSANWERVEQWQSDVGIVRPNEDGDWIAWVRLPQGLVRMNAEYGSANAAMQAVERVWKREEGKRNGTN